jgi:hypothetical protein
MNWQKKIARGKISSMCNFFVASQQFRGNVRSGVNPEVTATETKTAIFLLRSLRQMRIMPGRRFGMNLPETDAVFFNYIKFHRVTA